MKDTSSIFICAVLFFFFGLVLVTLSLMNIKIRTVRDPQKLRPGDLICLPVRQNPFPPFINNIVVSDEYLNPENQYPLYTDPQYQYPQFHYSYPYSPYFPYQYQYDQNVEQSLENRRKDRDQSTKAFILVWASLILGVFIVLLSLFLMSCTTIYQYQYQYRR